MVTLPEMSGIQSYGILVWRNSVNEKSAMKTQGVDTLWPPQLSELSKGSVKVNTSVTCFLHATITEQKEDIKCSD